MAQPDPWERAFSRKVFTDYLRAQRRTDRALAAILRDASREAERLLLSMPGETFSASVRRNQYALANSALREVSQNLWSASNAEIRAGIVRSAQLAGDANLALLQVLDRAGAPRTLLDSLHASARFAARQVESRYLNGIQLSPRVYRNRELTNGLLARRIDRGIALGKSAREIARDVSSLIRPDVRGGVSYAAMRLGRTELNNAFHTTSVSIARSQPWVEGMKWELSGSHPTADICDEFAERNEDGLGPGVYRTENVPAKPHPQCLCYTTTVTVGREQFINSLLSGDYDGYIDNPM